MPRSRKRSRLSPPSIAVAVLVISAVVAMGPGPSGADTTSAPSVYAPATRMAADAWTARQDAYLEAETAGGLDPTSPESLIATAERARRDPSFHGDLSKATAATFSDTLGAGFGDDFTISTLLTLWIADHDQLSPSLAAAIKAKVLSFKYWWTEAPLTLTQGASYYWTENHEILFASDEYLAGQAFPDDVFGSGMTGRQHMAHAETTIKRWIELRDRYGFSEFLSIPYMGYAMQGVLSLAEQADDPTLASMASGLLDVMFVELASSLQDGAIGSAKGRTYTGNLFDLYGGATPNIAALAFGTGTPPTGSAPAVAFAVANRYRPPEVAKLIADSTAVGVVRQHQGLPLDPTAPVRANPVAPDGLSFDDDDGLLVWWAMGAQLAWQVAPLSVATIEKYNLWNTPNFQAFGADVLQSIVKGKSPAELRVLAQSLAGWLNPGLLSAVDTYTWRSPDVMLSTAQDWRAGQRTQSALTSQATLDDGTSVFTSLPKGKPGNDGYWSGNGAAPRAAQNGTTSISIYAPQYQAGGTGDPSGYQDFTHTFFPQDRFDQVVQRDGWTFGRKGIGYVALWSWRPTKWVPFNGSVQHPDGVTHPYDLEATGGSDDVWITHVGRATDFSGAADPFTAFIDSVTAHAPVVQPLAGATACPASTPASLGSCHHAAGDGFLVKWTPATEPALGFGWTPKAATPNPPLTVAGTAVSLHDPSHRWQSPWATAGTDGHYHVAIDGQVLDLHLAVPPTIAAHLVANSVVLGRSAVVTGTVTPGATPRVVVQRGIGGHWTDRQAGVVAADGTFTIRIHPSQAGIYALRVRSNGSSIHSPTFFLRVRPAPRP